ncbi:hypothetical protein IE53DRAFT_340866 [Violaceomyces palustris]|uniref:Uncharacterized protein n=1 Tax=Violaceomyces palustris TaxID=1673888 RepID=A0ACD0P2U1_9BASI|nr:hypothetical protein IE53DRAFT_340866 [Violaceomyces palustris]
MNERSRSSFESTFQRTESEYQSSKDGHPAGSVATAPSPWSSSRPRDSKSTIEEEGLVESWDDQDRELDQLSESIQRQREISILMDREFDQQREVLEELDQQTDLTGLRLGGARIKLDQLAARLRGDASSWAILGLILLLVLLIFLFK